MPFRKSKPYGSVKPPVRSVVDWGDPINAGLVGCWLLNENGGMIARDIALGNHGALTNFASPPTSTSGWVPGRFGPAVYFDGTNDYITCPQNFLTFTAGLSVSLHVLFKAANNNSSICYKGNANEWSLDYGGGVFPRFAVQRGVNSASAAGSGVPATGRWYHVVGTYDNANARVYLDGVLLATTAMTSPGAVTATANAVTIGSRVAGANVFNSGLISDVRIYCRALVQGEVYRLCAEPFAGIVAPRRRVISQVASGIQFDAASNVNSGFKTANADYTFNRVVNSGNNRCLTFKVIILGTPGTTVTAITDDNTGTPVAAVKINAASSSTGAGIVEFWRVIAPVVGTKEVRVQLSGAVTSCTLCADYFNVHQTSPTANFNSAQATNGVGAADATVTITTSDVGSWVVAGIATTDATGITAGQTSRNNVNAAGSAGAAGDEDTNALVAVGTTAMTYPAIDGLAVWVIGGFELRLAGTSTAYSRTATDAPSVSDTVARVEILMRALADAPQTTDTIARALVLARAMADSPLSSDAATRLAIHPRSIVDTPQSSDLTTRLEVLIRSGVDVPQSSDTAARQETVARTTTDSLQSSDAASRVEVLARALIDLTTSSDVATRLETLARNSTDGFSSVDVGVRTCTATRSPSDSSASSDAAIRTFVGARLAADVPSSADIAVGVKGQQSVFASDSPTSTDSVVRVLHAGRSMVDSAASLDVAVRVAALLREAADATSSTDSAFRMSAKSRTSSDVPSSVDSASKTTGLGRSSIDSVVSSDAAVRRFSGLRAVLDSLTSTDTATATFPSFKTPRIIDLIGFDATKINLVGFDQATISVVGDNRE